MTRYYINEFSSWYDFQIQNVSAITIGLNYYTILELRIHSNRKLIRRYISDFSICKAEKLYFLMLYIFSVFKILSIHIVKTTFFFIYAQTVLMLELLKKKEHVFIDLLYGDRKSVIF